MPVMIVVCGQEIEALKAAGSTGLTSQLVIATNLLSRPLNLSIQRSVDSSPISLAG